MRNVMSMIGKAWSDNQSLLWKLAFELVIVFVGVTAAFAMENLREDAAEAKYRSAMIAALRPTLDDVIEHNAEFDAEITPKLAAFDVAIAAGEQPDIPIFRESNSERPPTRIWDGLVASGAARALEPELFFDLALFYTRQESFGERYVRYNNVTEQDIFAAGNDRSALYDPVTRRLRPEVAAHVDRLRDLQKFSKSITAQAVELRGKLAKLR